MPGVLGFQVQHYQVQTPVYQGPLDLLLQLIEQAALDITKIALAQVTDQYLHHIAQMEDLSPDEVSAFLVIAAKLVQIKSEALLPRPPQRAEGEEDPGEALVRQLREYRRFKQAAAWLKARREEGLQAFERVAVPMVTGQTHWPSLDVDALQQAARRAFALRPRAPLGTVISPPKITIREKIAAILQALRRQRRRLTFRTLLGRRPTRLEAVVTFLALLELVKRRFVRTAQTELFGEITIYPAEDAPPEDVEIVSEFGE